MSGNGCLTIIAVPSLFKSAPLLHCYSWRFRRRCPVLNLTFGKAYQAVGHREGKGRAVAVAAAAAAAGGGGWGVKEKRLLLAQLLSHILKANHASFLIQN